MQDCGFCHRYNWHTVIWHTIYCTMLIIINVQLLNSWLTAKMMVPYIIRWELKLCSDHWSNILFWSWITSLIFHIQKKNKPDISYLKNQPGLQHSDPFKSSPGSNSQLISDSVGTTSICSLLAFPLSVSLASSCLRCLCFSVSISNS